MAFRSKLLTATVLLLLSIAFILSLASLLLYVRIDNIVNVDLYSYGLQFSSEWASAYRFLIHLFWASLGVALATIIVTFAASYVFKIRKSLISKWICILFPLLVAGLTVFAISLIMDVDWLVNRTMYQYGLQMDSAWATNYWAITRTSIALMAISFPLYIVISIATWFNTGIATLRDITINLLGKGSFPGSYKMSRTKRSASAFFRKYLVIGMVGIIATIIVATAFASNLAWKGNNETKENFAPEATNIIGNLIENENSNFLDEKSEDISDLVDGDISVSTPSPFGLFLSAYADYYGENLIMNNSYFGFARLEVVNLNETHAELLFYIGIDNEFQIVLDYEDYVNKPLNEMGFEIEGMRLENISPTEQANFASWGERTYKVYEYSSIANTEPLGKTTFLLDNEVKWPLEISIEIEVEGDYAVLELTLDNTNIEWLK